MKNWILIAALVPLACGLTACRQTGFRRVSPSAQSVLIELPELGQEEANRCGLVALAVLCAHYGVTLSEQEQLRLAEQADRNHGLSGAELRRALEGLGMRVSIFSGTLDDAPTGLRTHVDEGRPLLAMISLDGETNHYCLVNGYDPARDEIYLLEPRQGQVGLSSARFASVWDEARRFALVAVPDPLAQAGGAVLPEHSEAALEEMRAGDINLSDRELMIIGITAGAILLLVLIF